MNIIFTETAQKYLADLLNKQSVTGTGVRLFVNQPGLPVAETCLGYCKPGEEKETDVLLALTYFNCYVDANSIPFLEEALVDFLEDKLGGQLTIKAPYAKISNIDASSPLNERIEYILQTEINPSLASHGGMVSLVEIHENVAVLRFGGGCQGCGMVDLTLKGSVEKTLLEKLPELKEIRDITDHNMRDNAYYK